MSTQTSQVPTQNSAPEQTTAETGGTPQPVTVDSRKKPKNHALDLAHTAPVDSSPNRSRRRIPSNNRHDESPTRRNNGPVSPLIPDDDDENGIVERSGIQGHTSQNEDVVMRGPGSNSVNSTPGAEERTNEGDEPLTLSQIRGFEMTRDEIEEHERPDPILPYIINGGRSTIRTDTPAPAANQTHEPGTPATPEVMLNLNIPKPFSRNQVEEEFTLADVPAASAQIVKDNMSSECPNGLTPTPLLSMEFTRTLVQAGVAVNNGSMERFARDLPTITRGFTKTELIKIFSAPRNWAWGVDFNGGNYLNSRLPEIAHRKQTFLNQRLEAGTTETIIPYMDVIAVRAPLVQDSDPKDKGPKNSKGKGKRDNKPKGNQPDKYAGPIAMAIKFEDAGIMQQFVRQQSFGINVGAALHIIPVTNTTRSHAVGCARSNQFVCTPVTVVRMIETIQRALEGNEGFRRLVSSLIMGSDSTTEKVRAITGSIQLTPLPTAITVNHVEWNAFCITADVTSTADDPFVRDRDENKIRAYIRSLKEVSHTYLKVYIEPMECTLCKCDTHYTFHCPFSTLDTWNGPREQVSAAVANYIKTERA
ncbi:hypothetical protein F5878DRAFT_665269 [Lentinula raphanica]|uniref:Uncharacterized protein n=1 Tax=Lentinula raphanica TaxID=153919 RepID=A0AA38UCZ9_9AGAR|nr:hypothetical protein F5878DRAFT_665269 [Lentinula raphanica]